MDYGRFIRGVQHRTRLGSRGDAERATWATWQTLAERMADGGAQNLAAQLPSEIREYLRRNAPEQAGIGASSSLDDVFDQVTERESVDRPAAVFHARVLEFTHEATTGGLMHTVRDKFPADFDRLFEAGCIGRIHAENHGSGS